MSNLYGLTEATFADRDPAKIASAIISGYEAAYYKGTNERITLAVADPRRLFLLSIAAVIVQQRNLIDYTGKQNLLAYADDGFLDHLGILVGVPRLDASAASTTIRFTLSKTAPGVTIIPAGTRVTPGGEILYFATTENLEIPAGNLFGDVPATCLVAGKIGNGFLPEQIDRLVDPLSYIQSVANTTLSEGGADVEDKEHYRDRIHLAPEAYSNAGSRGAYEFWAKSASSLIVDVGVDSPSPGVVNLYPLLEGGEIPGEEMLEKVLAKCNDDTVRPMTDDVYALSPEVASYELHATWYLDRANATSALAIETAVNKAAADWVLWQKSKLGRDINPDELTKRAVSAGAKRIVIESPEFRALGFNELAVAENVVLAFGGMEDA